ncbi:MAG: pyrroline-5-carboxylate reductase, partial [Planctomycetes bacterium]|nr:pyrroline-5-carboxylate reductase [Planctomycetota bacterium]
MANEWRDRTLGIIGAGSMAEALLRGVLAAKLIQARQVVVYDTIVERRNIFVDMGCFGVDEPYTAYGQDVVLLSVKPQILQSVLSQLTANIKPGALVISIAAGVTLHTVEKALPPGTGVVRVMPNTPLLVGQGVSALAGNTAAGQAGLALVQQLFSCAGKAFAVQENLLDAVTAVSGSGPAYLFRFAEAMIAAAIQMGLPPEMSEQLVFATLKGSAEMLNRFGNPAELRQRVTS